MFVAVDLRLRAKAGEFDFRQLSTGSVHTGLQFVIQVHLRWLSGTCVIHEWSVLLSQ